jgi:DNA invertase Pin-like site-specific DNA recombinase
MKLIKIALYLRISKADGTQDTTRQLNELRDFANSQNWQIVEEIEEHISGTRTKRSGT